MVTDFRGGTASPVRAWTDGACAKNPGPGGWGVILVIDGTETELSGGEASTTNNRMEMLAVLAAIEAAPAGRRLVLTTDSEYVKKGATQWVTGWKRRGWRTSAGAAVKNQDIWERIDAAGRTHGKVEWRWVRGHNGDPMNERADRLAVRERDRAAGRAT